MGNLRFGNGQTGIIYGIDPIAISVIMYNIIIRLCSDGVVDLERRKRPPRPRSVYYIIIIIVHKYNYNIICTAGNLFAGNRKTETPSA